MPRLTFGSCTAAMVCVAALSSAVPLSGQTPEQPVYCFAPGTPQEIMDARRHLLGPVADPQYYTANRWSGSTGNPRALTWSFIPDGVAIPYTPSGGSTENRSSALFSRMDAKFAAAGGRQVWIQQFEAAFARWAALTGVSYTRIKYQGNDWDDGASFGSSGNSNHGDIRITMIVQDGQWNVLAYNYYPSHGDMVLDADENWGNSANNYRFLRNTLMHEHGHGLGLNHVCPLADTKLMEPQLSTAFDGPQHDDIRAIDYLYGDDFENNDAVSSANFIGTLTMSTSMDFGAVPSPTISNGTLLSIDSASDVDYYRFALGSGGAGLTLTLIPAGLSYDSSVQASDGKCNSGTTINSMTAANLKLQLLASNGTTVLATRDVQPAGGNEGVTDLLLTQAGDYYLRVSASGVVTESQLYHIQISVRELDCNHNGVADATDLASGTSRDCNHNGRLDECETEADSNSNQVPDTCEWAHGDFDLDGDIDMADFGFLQACLTGTAVAVVDTNCTRAKLDADTDIDSGDIQQFRLCLTRDKVPYAWDCRQIP